MANDFTRRNLLLTSLTAAPLLVLPAWAGAATGTGAGARCEATPRSTEGPFYPTTAIETRTSLLRPGAAGAGGTKPIVVMGQVTGPHCRPLAHAEVEIWQADTHGRYHHPGGARGAELDPDFLYWGKALTDAGGNYRFLTIPPAAYPAGGSWMRPPHIHYKVRAPGRRGLTTQMYFPGNPLNERDYLFRHIPTAQRPAALAVPISKPADESLDAAFYRFDLGLG